MSSDWLFLLDSEWSIPPGSNTDWNRSVTCIPNENGSGVDVSEKEILEDTTEKEEGAKYVRADSPFVFILKDDTTNDIIYMGRIADPSL